MAQWIPGGKLPLLLKQGTITQLYCCVDSPVKRLDDLLTIAGNMEGKTICVFADAAAWPVQSYIAKFRDEFEEYIRTGRKARMKEAACPS